MRARFVLIAAILCTSTSALAAAQRGEPTQAAGQPQAAPPQIVLASAEDVHSSQSNDQQSPTPPKRPRIARVTTCRCGGDPQAIDPEGQQEQ